MLRSYLLLLVAVSGFIQKSNGDTNYRLNSPLTPVHYSIVITPYLNTQDSLAFTFDGEVSLVLETDSSNIDKIRLHSQDLKFSAANISLTSEKSVIGLNPANPIEFIDNYSFVDINLEAPMQPGTRYTLTISYRGPIRSDLNGFYRSSYMENGDKKWLAATQMEPTHARKVFPCLDEPQYKAIFSLTIDRPENYQPSLANTKLLTSLSLSNGYIREVFQPTPRMSTYLLAFMVSEYTAAKYSTTEGKEFGVYTRPDATNQSQYAFDFGQRVVTALSNYFGIDYYSTDENLKLDHVALPDFRAGAMENWGLIKYRESLLLYVPEESTPYYKYRVAQIVAHETTHMWFGNLVTCHWWSNTWLNEGFANYFQDYITALIEPEVGSEDQLVIGSVYAAYSADEVPTAAPITNENVNSPDEISVHFGTISYQKAGSVIRMIHHLIGDEAFRIGLNAYLVANEFDIGYPEKMYSSLNLGVQNTSSLAGYPQADITEIMNSWVSQAGHPIVKVEADYETGEVTLTQKRFYQNSSYASDELYMIPITYTTKNKSLFSDTKPAFVMTNKTHVLNVSEILDHNWIMLNIQETGLYRVNYDSHTWSMIASSLKSDSRTDIHHLNRAKIVNDMFALLTADEIGFDVLYEVLGFLSDETDYSVWYAALSGLNALRTRFIGTDAVEEISKFSLNLVENVVNELGYNEKATDNLVTLRNRMQILEFACQLNHQDCIDNTVAMFKEFRINGTRIPPSLRPVVYCSGLKYGNEEDFDFLWNEMVTTNVANEAIVIENALGCTKVEGKLNAYLDSTAEEESPIRWQDITIPLTSILAHHENADWVLSYVEANYAKLSTIYPSMETVIAYVANALHTDEQFDEFARWLSSCEDCSEDVKKSGRNYLENARATAKWANDHKDNILKTLRNGSNAVSPSFMVYLVTVLAMIYKIL